MAKFRENNLIFILALVTGVFFSFLAGYENYSASRKTETTQQVSTHIEESRVEYFKKLINRGILSDKTAMFWHYVTDENE